MRSHDRRAIAEDIFDVAGASDVDAAHVEEVSKRYRERLAGAQKILLARQIGDEILRWQRAPTRSVAPRNQDSRREDDEIIGIQLDSMSLSVADVARAVADKRAAEEAPAPRESGRSEPPASGMLGPRVPSGTRPASSTQWSASGPRASSASSASIAAVAPSSPPSPSASPSSAPAAERPRSEGAIDWAAPPRSSSSAPSSGDDGGGLWSPPRAPSSPAPRRDTPSLPPLGLPPAGPSPLDAPSLGPPLDLPRSSGGEAPPGPSSPPSRPPSHPPSRRPRPPDGQHTTFELDGDAIRAVPPPAPATSASAGPPVATAGDTRSSFAVPRAASKARTNRQPIVAGAVVAVILGIVITWRAAVAFGNKPVEVSGHTASEHLGVTLDFAETWIHERKKDDDGEQLGYRRATSTYYQGVTAEDFIMQVTVVTLSPEDRPASADDVRKIGGHQRMSPVTDQVCAAVEEESESYRCLSKTTYKSRSFAVLEQYFLSGTRVVYVRALVEVLADVPPPLPKKGEVSSAAPKKPPLIAAVDERKLQAIIDSIQPL